ncbi:hypothetical protein NQ318_000505 [Aromia moschata]|uniref:EGF-like domain-containing protein n=1 Tax=Aromia moschata TaxID=1265417 RepID=A0AAV8YGW2_9CUCU|nr:hypothetical protein NQ318_000505 [Aromia moschata]
MNKDNGPIPTSPLFALINKDSYGSVNRDNKFGINSARHARDSQYQCVRIAGSCGGGICAENAECLFDDQVPTFYCACKQGYVGDGITECKERVAGCDTLNNCGIHASCQYNPEAYTYKCICNEGFFGDGLSCYAERNCHIDPSMCDVHAVCLTEPVNTVTDVLTVTAAYYLNASYYQYMLNLHKYKVTKRP